MPNFADKLVEAMRARDSRLVVGLDPDLERIRHIPEFAKAPATDALRDFCAGIAEACADVCCAVKPQIAFYDAHGSAGWDALADVCRSARRVGLPMILDAKRGDIGSTSKAYARLVAPDGPLGADAITLNPYLGTDSIAPFLDASRQHGTGLFILAKTSNPSATELQDLELADGRRVCEAVADLVHAWGEDLVGESGWSAVGAVVGATQYEDLERLRLRMPRSILLLPGVGAQGAEIAKLRPAFGEDTFGACVNSSRGILYAWENASPSDPGRWREAAAEAAARTRAELAELFD